MCISYPCATGKKIIQNVLPYFKPKDDSYENLKTYLGLNDDHLKFMKYVTIQSPKNQVDICLDGKVNVVLVSVD